MKYASICGVFLIVLFHISGYFGVNPFIELSHLLFDLIILSLFIFFATKEFKDSQDGQILHFWQGMTIGFTVYAFASLLFVLSLVIYFQLDENVITRYHEAATRYLLDKKETYIERFGKKGFEEQLINIKNEGALDLWISAGFKKVMAGFFVSPIIAIILRKKPL